MRVILVACCIHFHLSLYSFIDVIIFTYVSIYMLVYYIFCNTSLSASSKSFWLLNDCTETVTIMSKNSIRFSLRTSSTNWQGQRGSRTLLRIITKSYGIKFTIIISFISNVIQRHYTKETLISTVSFIPGKKFLELFL